MAKVRMSAVTWLRGMSLGRTCRFFGGSPPRPPPLSQKSDWRCDYQQKRERVRTELGHGDGPRRV